MKQHVIMRRKARKEGRKEEKQREEIRKESAYFEIKGRKNSAALVRKRTIPTERPPLVGEVSANFSG
jgi:hypothetical protein